MPSDISRPLLPTPTPALLGRLADLLPWPLLVLEPDAQLVYANQAGRGLLARKRPLRQDRLGHVGPTLARRRADFQQAVLRARAGGGGALLLAGRPQATQARLERLPGDGPVLLLLSVSLPPGDVADGLVPM